jgi:hypothetical protein
VISLAPLDQDLTDDKRGREETHRLGFWRRFPARWARVPATLSGEVRARDRRQ